MHLVGLVLKRHLLLALLWTCTTSWILDRRRPSGRLYSSSSRLHQRNLRLRLQRNLRPRLLDLRLRLLDLNLRLRSGGLYFWILLLRLCEMIATSAGSLVRILRVVGTSKGKARAMVGKAMRRTCTCRSSQKALVQRQPRRLLRLLLRTCT